MRSNSRLIGIVMTAEGMTSISVSYEVRRQLNTLRERMKDVADVEVEHLVDRLNLSPFQV